MSYDPGGPDRPDPRARRRAPRRGIGAAATMGLVLFAALTLLGGVFLSRWFPLRIGATHEVTPAVLWEELLVKDQPLPGDGPVAVEIGYRIRDGEARAFLQAISQLRASRRRDGANFWRVYRDLQDPTRYLERFIVSSWAEYLHQRSRSTLADEEIENRVRVFLREGETARTSHFIAEL